MRFSFIPREQKFFDMFDEGVSVMTSASAKFLTMVKEYTELDARSNELKHLEGVCDEIVEHIILALDRSFITPFDREDIHALATSIDDVLDNLDETAHRFAVFRIDQPPPAMVQMATIIQECTLHLDYAIRHIRAMKNTEEVQNHLVEIGRLENEADIIYRDSDSTLFANPPDILTLIKMRELYWWLETTVDACKNTALVISGIFIKGS
jgi:predicted phosphate transport protein (TIGR00153 family)